ncbi:hypothetical protein GBA52_016103 [Prunus armeniaca]|nr:hypothetical protein GBA52_016103 [Prunus armeniaca]
MERFGMEKDYEDSQWLGGEFYYRKRKDNVLYGIFSADSEDDEDNEGSRKRRKEQKVDLTKPVNFVSTGIVLPNQEMDKNLKQQNDDLGACGVGTSGLGFGAAMGFNNLNSGLGLNNSNLDPTGGEEEDEENDTNFLPTAFGKKIKEGAERRQKEREKLKLLKQTTSQSRSRRDSEES